MYKFNCIYILSYGALWTYKSYTNSIVFIFYFTVLYTQPDTCYSTYLKAHTISLFVAPRVEIRTWGKAILGGVLPFRHLLTSTQLVAVSESKICSPSAKKITRAKL